MVVKNWVYLAGGLTCFAVLFTLADVASYDQEMQKTVCAAAEADNKSLDAVEWNYGFTDAELAEVRRSNPLFCDAVHEINCSAPMEVN